MERGRAFVVVVGGDGDASVSDLGERSTFCVGPGKFAADLGDVVGRGGEFD